MASASKQIPLMHKTACSRIMECEWSDLTDEALAAQEETFNKLNEDRICPMCQVGERQSIRMQYSVDCSNSLASSFE